MFIVRFELRNGAVTAVGRVTGALADSVGNVLGLVDEELAMPVGTIDATCNQLRMDLAATEADVLNTPVRFDPETAGFDSRDGAMAKALRVLCTAWDALRAAPAPATRVKLLNDIVAALEVPRR